MRGRWVSGLGESAQSLSAIRRRQARSAALVSEDEAPPSPSYDDMYHRGAVPAQPLTAGTLSRFFELALWPCRPGRKPESLNGRCGTILPPAISIRRKVMRYFRRSVDWISRRGSITTHPRNMVWNYGRVCSRPHCSSDGSASAKRVSLRPHLGSLAGGVEVWRASVSLLQP